MKKVILYIASSLDGYIAREKGNIDWLPQIDTLEYDKFYQTIDVVIMGKTTYDQVLTFGEYPYKDKRSYVFTRNQNSVKDENVEFTSSIDEFVKDILPNVDGNIWLVGGGQIISTFVNHGIIDEIILSIVPIILGKGIPLLRNIQKETKLKLIKSINHNELIELHFQVLK